MGSPENDLFTTTLAIVNTATRQRVGLAHHIEPKITVPLRQFYSTGVIRTKKHSNTLCGTIIVKFRKS